MITTTTMNWIDDTVRVLHTALPVDLADREDIIEFVQVVVQEAHTKGTQEALAKVEEWVVENKLDNVWVQDPSPMGGIMCRECEGQEDCECATYNVALEKVLHHLQQLKDNKV